jgi:Kef-type K+ transport system membrane component KefB
MTFGLLTPFYFIRAGAFVSVTVLIAAPLAFVVLLLAKLLTKSIAVLPTARALGYPRRERIYTTMMMSTGLTFGTISALFGLSHGIIDQAQYSFLVATVIGSAIVPTMIGNTFFLPRHLILPAGRDAEPAATPATATASAVSKGDPS